MSKSLVIVETPKSCEECNLCVAVLGKYYCAAKGINILKGERDCSCQLVAVPKEFKPENAHSAIDRARMEGWNACIDRILGGSS